MIKIGRNMLRPYMTSCRRRECFHHIDDVGIGHGLVEGDVTKQKLTAEKIIQDELVVIVSTLHPWSKKKEISIFELTKAPFIVRAEGSGTRQIVEKHLNKYGISTSDMKISMVLGSTEAIKEAVESGIGVSIGAVILAWQLSRSEQPELAQARDRVRVDVLSLDEPIRERDHVETVPLEPLARRLRDQVSAAHRAPVGGRRGPLLDDEALARRVLDVDVYARASPEHKLRLVEAAQRRGQVAAMTGDGVNDSPALRRADIGVAMGIKGTEAAKEAAEMVLADDNFASIAHAVEEGRTVHDNLQKALVFILPTNAGQALVIVAAVLFGIGAAGAGAGNGTAQFELPITPAQILWVNMITAVTLALALAFEPPEAEVMKRPPRDPKASLLSGYFLWRIGLVSAVMCAGTFGIFLWLRHQGAAEDIARTVAVNTIVMFEVFYLFNTRFILAPVLNVKGLLGSRPVLLAIALVALKALVDAGLRPAQRTTLHISNYEEVGHGGASGFPPDLAELLTLDMAAVGEGQNSDEFSAAICVKDTGGPYQLEMRRKLVNIAEAAGKTSPNDRANFHSIARGSAMECGAILDVIRLLKIAPSDVERGKELLTRMVSMLSKMCR